MTWQLSKTGGLMTIHNPKSKEEWLALRHRYISSTESSALKGMSPYLTPFELFHAKQQAEPTSFEMSERMEWGLRLEEAVARAIADEYGVKVRKLNAYVSRDGTGMGSSFDYEIVGIKDSEALSGDALRAMYNRSGPGILEIKCVDWMVWKRHWVTEGDAMEAPPHIELQVQHQLHCIEREWAAIGVLVSGNTLRMLVRDRDLEVGQILEDASKQFWRDLKAGKTPPAEMPRDAELIARLYNFATPDKVLDAQGDSETAQKVTALCAEYVDMSNVESGAASRKKAIKGELLQLIGDAERVIAADGFTISAGVVAEAEVPAYTRKAYRNFRVSQKKGKNDE